MRHFPARKPKNASGAWSTGRDRSTQKRFRVETLTRDGNQCTFIEEDGRCEETEDLQAHHLPDGSGATLCRRHHKIVDPFAR